MKKILLSLFIFSNFAFCFASNKTVQVETEHSNVEINENNKFIKRKVAIGRFSNETQYAKGLFYDKKNDPMGKQALDILSSKLAASGKFLLLERTDLDEITKELANSDKKENILNADYLILGSITEFGRKNVGDVKLFSTAKTQIVEAGISIRLVDVQSGLIIYSDEAKGTAEEKTKTTMGYGGKSGYDATLSDKAISVAISKLVENVINKCTDKPWRGYFLSKDKDGIVISGGKSQGIEINDTFIVKKAGRKVKNPQTGIMIELPGKKIGEIKVDYTGGETPETEFSIVSFTEGDIDGTNLSNYYIEEKSK